MKKQQIKSAISAAILGVASPLAMVLPASAATVTWTGADSDSMNSGLNWVSGGILVSGDTAVFPASAKFQMPNNDISSLSLVKILFNGEVSGSSSKSYEVTGNGLTITESVEAVMTGNGGSHQIKTDFTLGGNVTLKTTGSNTLTIGDGVHYGTKGGGGDEKTIALGTNDLTIDVSGGTIILTGNVTGSGNIIKKGDGKVFFNTKADAYTGSTTVERGEFTVGDENSQAGNIVLNGGKLKGSGTVKNVTLNSGSIAPGNSPGVINTNNLTLTGGTYEVELGGTADGEFDQTNVTGTVDLGSGTTLNLTLFGGYEPEVNDVFTIINNDGSDAVNGTFNGLANGDKVTLGEYTYQVNYDAGDGNDVRVLVTGTPSAPDTGIGSIISNPLVTLFAAVAALGVIGGLKYADNKRK